MKITKKQAQSFINAIKDIQQKMKSYLCLIQERTPIGNKKESDCHILDDTDYFDDCKCNADNMLWFLDKIYKGEHPNVLSFALYTRSHKDPQLWDHVWVENCKEQFEKHLSGDNFIVTTTKF